MEGIVLIRKNSDTGEHISNEKNELEYVAFPICNETGKPLELRYGIEEGMLSPPSFLFLLQRRTHSRAKKLNSYRTQLHDPLHNRPFLPPPRILHPQRRSALLPPPCSTSIPRPPSASLTNSPTSRVRPPNLRPRRHPPTLTPPRLNTPKHTPALRTKTPPATSRFRCDRLRSRLLHLTSLSHHGPGSFDEEIGNRRPITVEYERAVVPDTAFAEGEWED